MRKQKTRNAGTWTEARFHQQIRSALRNGFKYWKPIIDTKNKARRKYVGNNKRQKWEYQCAICKQWYMGKEIQIDHIVPVGSLKCLDDVKGFIERLTMEDGFQCLCKPCHQLKTNAEKQRKTI